MKKITLLWALLFSVITYGQVFPTISDGSSETWYYIQFEAGDGVIQDMGNNIGLETKLARENTDSQLWKITGTAGNYIITNKLGRNINWDGSLHIADASASQLFSLEVYGGGTSYVLQRASTTQSINQQGSAGIDKLLASWVSHANNALNFRLPLDVNGGLLPALTASLPTISSGGSETWYNIQFAEGNGVLEDKGDGNNIETNLPYEGEDNQLWKITGTPGAYVLTSKLGNKIDFSSTNFTTSTSSTTTFTLVENGQNWELQRSGEMTSMNQEGGVGYGRILAESAVANPNNPLTFVLPENTNYAPKVSIGGTSHWYGIQFVAGDGVIQDMGTDEFLLTKALDGTDAQLFKITGTADNFTLTSKLGNIIDHNGSLFTATAGSTITFKLVTSYGSTSWDLQRVGSSNVSINQNQSTGLDKQLGEWTVGHASNQVKFVFGSTTLGVANDKHSKFKIYPTITSDFIKVESKVSEKLKISIYNTLGVKIVNYKVLENNTGKARVDMRYLSAGIYIVKVKAGGSMTTLKVIKK